MCSRRFIMELKSEFKLQKFCFNGISNQRFFYSMWKIPPIIYILVKLALTIHCVVIVIWTALNSPPHIQVEYYKYLTHWTYILLCLHLLVSTSCLIAHHAANSTWSTIIKSPHGTYDALFTESSGERESDNEESLLNSQERASLTQYDPNEVIVVTNRLSLPWYLKVCWVLQGMACVTVLFVTIMYFAALYPRQHPHGGIELTNLELHGLSSVVIAIDFTFSSVPVRLLHAVYLIAYMVVYVLFSAVYWAATNHRAIYPVILDWNNPKLTILVNFGALLLALSLYFIFFLLYKLKLYVWSVVRS